VLGPAPFLIVGILNVTPDSFYDGGAYNSLDRAIQRAEEILTGGGHIIDVGGESTRPFSQRVELEQELARVLPVIKEISAKFPQVFISVDTYKAEVARQSLEAGAVIINDVSACRFDSSLIDVLVQYKPGYVLMHSLGRPETMQQDPKYTDVIDEIRSFFEKHF